MTDVFLKIIEEFADGFLILDGQRRVIFFNDVLQRTTGLRSQDIFSREDEFLGELGVLDGASASHTVDIADHEGTVRKFTVSSLAFESGSGDYLLVRVKPVERGVSPASAAGWEQLFRNIGDPMYTADLAGRILCANPSFYRIVGYEDTEALPYLSELYLNPAELEDKILRLTEADSVFNLETHFVTRDRELRRVLDSSWISRDDAGNVTGYTSHLKDVTYVKNLEARLKISERNYIFLFDSILSSIVIVDPLGRILNCNYSAEKLFGYRWQELAGRDYDEVFRPHKKGSVLADVLKQAAAGKGPHVETDVPRRCKDGTIRFTYAAYTALVSSDGENIGWSINERDLTDRHRLEEKLKDSFDPDQEHPARLHHGVRDADGVPRERDRRAPPSPAAVHQGARPGAREAPEVRGLHHDRLHRGSLPLLRAPRRRQGRDLGCDPAEAGQAHPRGVRAHQAARLVRRRRAALDGQGDRRPQLPHPRQGDRLLPPRALGRHGLPHGTAAATASRCRRASWRWPTSTTPSRASGPTTMRSRTRRR